MLSSILPKTNEKIRLYYYGTSSRIVFVCFLGELKTPKRHFEINWPLKWDVQINDKVLIWYMNYTISNYQQDRWVYQKLAQKKSTTKKSSKQIVWKSPQKTLIKSPPKNCKASLSPPGPRGNLKPLWPHYLALGLDGFFWY